MENTILARLASIPLFEGIPRDQLKGLSTIVRDREFRKGETIFSEGEEGAGFYVVLSGRVKIYKVSADGKEQILHLFGPGEPFGEAPVFAGRRFPANAEAMEDSRTYFFPRAAFIDLIKQTPELALSMLAVLSLRLRRFALLIEDLSLKEVPSRLAAYLLYLREEKGGSKDLILDLPKGQLASLLGTIPETLSRILGKMSKGGLIQLEGPRIKILDVEGLEDLAEGAFRL